MRGYVSTFAPPDEGWPTTYVIVQTSPEAWMATLPLDELMQAVEERRSVPLREIPHQWKGDEFVVELGPVRLRGNSEEWRALGRRLLHGAGSASELYEAPGTTPWTGSAETISVEELQPEHGSGHLVAALGTPSPTSVLANAGGFSGEQFTELFGLGWRPASARDQGELFEDDLFVWGEPPQLAAAVSPDGLRVGLPGGEWHGPGEFKRMIVDPVAVDAAVPEPMVEAFVKDLLRRRRRTFTWCRYCGDQLTPELRDERDLCFGCASGVLGTVY